MQAKQEKVMPEWEELSATACSVQNIYLMAHALGIGGELYSPSRHTMPDAGYLPLLMESGPPCGAACHVSVCRLCGALQRFAAWCCCGGEQVAASAQSTALRYIGLTGKCPEHLKANPASTAAFATA